MTTNSNITQTMMAEVSEKRRMIWNRILLVCGIVSSVLYIVATILGAQRWQGYDPFSQTVSELIAVDAPSAPLVIPLFILYGLLIYAFGLGIWRTSDGKRTLRVAAALIIAKEILGLLVTLFAPMHLRGVEGTLSDTLHAALTGVGVLLCMFPAMGFAAAAFGRRFRLYTAFTMLVFLVFGAMAGMQSSNVAANLPTPWLGIYERVNIFTYMLWIVVLAVTMLRRKQEA